MHEEDAEAGLEDEKISLNIVVYGDLCTYTVMLYMSISKAMWPGDVTSLTFE